MDLNNDASVICCALPSANPIFPVRLCMSVVQLTEVLVESTRMPDMSRPLVLMFRSPDNNVDGLPSSASKSMNVKPQTRCFERRNFIASRPAAVLQQQRCRADFPLSGVQFRPRVSGFHANPRALHAGAPDSEEMIQARSKGGFVVPRCEAESGFGSSKLPGEGSCSSRGVACL